jgi:hypothetical protein
MNILKTLYNFLQNPDNAWMLYILAAILLVVAYKLRKIKKAKLANGETPGPAMTRGIYLTGIIGYLLLVFTFYFSYVR